ncbi:MAG: sugar ABC transporter permease [Planctomycetes bacterium]|nr:sugar ABC transporter permease [Planctomycetota bacterium]
MPPLDAPSTRLFRNSYFTQRLFAWVFLAPAVFFYLTFVIYPLVTSLVYSFFNVQAMGPNARFTYVGLDNFRAVLEDDVFRMAAKNTLVWACSSPFLEIPLGLILAMALRAGTRASRIYRMLWFVPVLIPQIVVGIIWAWLLNFDWGIINNLLRVVGLGALARPWLGDPATALPSLIGVTTWVWTGFNMVILLTAVSSVPEELIDAAKIDGAGWLRTLFCVIIPYIRPVIVNLMILCFIGKMKVYDLVWVTTYGGPLWSTETVATYTVKRAFFWNSFEKGYPSAMATLWFTIILIVSLFANLFLLKRRDD